MNVAKYIFLIGAILFGGLGMVAMLMASDPSANAIWNWTAWLAYVPAFLLLGYIAEDYGISSAYTLWAGGTVIIIALFVMLFGESWGEVLGGGQYLGLGLVVLGLIGLSMTKTGGA